MTLIVAEVSANHNGRLDDALSLIELAKCAGADAVKFQCWLRPLAICGQAPGMWSSQSLTELYEKARTPQEWFPRLFAHAAQIGIWAFASVFDDEALAFIRQWDVPYLKIASSENTHYPLIRAAAKTGIPLVISTGGMGWNELHELDEALISWGAMDVTYLKCTLAYPAPLEALNLGCLDEMKWRFPNRKIGYSDHLAGKQAAIVATAKGATMIERHIALDHAALDADFSSVGMKEFGPYVWAVRDVATMNGATLEPLGAELTKLKRCCYVINDIKLNERFTVDNIAVLRGPGGGLHPKHWDDLIETGVATRPLKRGDPITSECFQRQEHPSDRRNRFLRDGIH